MVMTDQQPQFSPGDIVIHPLRPEWGQGRVERTSPAVFQGKKGQSLIVTFANHGRVTINTAVAPLASAQTKGPTHAMKPTFTQSSSEQGWLGTISGTGSDNPLAALPDACNDPFASDRQRLEATAATYRYSTEARSLIDWAVAQTGLDDPLSQYTRHDLEQAFPRFARDREKHLRDLVFQMKRANKSDIVKEVAAATRIPAAKQAIEKALRG